MDLTSVEFDLLALFLESPGRVISRDELVRAVLGRETCAFRRSIDVHVSKLRKKLAAAQDGSERIKAIRSVGYVYDAAQVSVMRSIFWKIFLWF